MGNFSLSTEISVCYWDILTCEYTNDIMYIANLWILNCSYQCTNILNSQFYESVFINWQLFIINYGQKGYGHVIIVDNTHTCLNYMIIFMSTNL